MSTRALESELTRVETIREIFSRLAEEAADHAKRGANGAIVIQVNLDHGMARSSELNLRVVSGEADGWRFRIGPA